MFVLSEFKDHIRILPSNFGIPTHEAITDEVNRKLANKVVHNVGLVIALFDIMEIRDMVILPGDGSAFADVQFRCVVFRPLREEIIMGKIKSCSHEGIHVTLGFFDDIFIHPDAIMRPCRFDEDKQTWIWEFEDEQTKIQFPMEKDDQIRFRVINETFVDVTPSGPDSGLETLDNEKKIPYSIMGSIQEYGLGLPSWWTNESNE